jgi:hypothetical protein
MAEPERETVPATDAGVIGGAQDALVLTPAWN